MLNIIGVEISGFPFGDLEFVGTLLFAEYPTTVIYSVGGSVPVIREWIDCSEDGTTDRFYYYQSSKKYLNQFIKGEITHADLVVNAKDNVYAFEDINDEALENRKLVFKINFPIKYLPGSLYKFTEEDGVDTASIKEYFGLGREETITLKQQVQSIAEEKLVETYNLHLNNGHNVTHGVASTDLLGKSLLHFDVLHREAALDVFIGRGRGEVTAKLKKTIMPYASTEVFMNIAASYSVLIKPKASRYILFNGEGEPGNAVGSSELIAEKIFSLISASKNYDVLNTSSNNYSPYLIEALRVMLKDIQTSKAELDFSWFSPNSRIEFDQSIHHQSANIMLDNIGMLNSIHEETFLRKGIFESLNCSTGHFAFYSLQNEYFAGHFDEILKEGLRAINFVDQYEVTIANKVTRVAGRTVPKIKNTLTYCIKVEV